MNTSKKEPKLTFLQKLWLYSRGERDQRDVMVVDDDLYVIMTSYRKDKFIPIPSNEFILKTYYKSKQSTSPYAYVLRLRTREN